VGALAGAAVALWLIAALPAHASRVREVTRDSSLGSLVADAARTVDELSGKDVVLVAPWGHTFWALAYARGFQGAFPDAEVVDHNADMGVFLEAGRTMLMPSDTLYVLSPEWWRERAAGATIEEPRPGVIAIRAGAGQPDEKRPPTGGAADDRGRSAALRSAPHRVNDEINLTAAEVRWSTNQGDPDLELLVEWAALRRPRANYSVAVHLLAGDEVLTQADAVNPADGWSATGQWSSGDRVRDAYLIPDADPRADAVRVTMYRATDGGFDNGEWLVLPLPARSE
jgi:hypothetical protein